MTVRLVTGVLLSSSFDALAVLLSSPDLQEPVRALLTPYCFIIRARLRMMKYALPKGAGTVHATSGSQTAWSQPRHSGELVLISVKSEYRYDVLTE